MSKKIEEQLREQIKTELTKVTRANSPAIYNSLFNGKGQLKPYAYPIMERRVIDKMLQNNMPATSAIVQIEIEMTDE